MREWTSWLLRFGFVAMWRLSGSERSGMAMNESGQGRGGRGFAAIMGYYTS